MDYTNVTPIQKKPCHAAHAAAEFDAWNHGRGFLQLAVQAKQEICYWKAMPDAGNTGKGYVPEPARADSCSSWNVNESADLAATASIRLSASAI